MYDLKITNARLRGHGDERFTIGIEDKRIAAIAPALDQPSAQQLDAGGNLVTESFVNGHLHLCKVYTLERAGQKALEEYQQDGMSHALDSIRSAAAFKTQYDRRWIIENVRKACDLAVRHGVTHIRAFADVDSKSRLEGVAAVLQAWNAMTAQAIQMPAFGVSIDRLTREELRHGYWAEFIFPSAHVCAGMPFERFLFKIEPDYRGINLVRCNGGKYEGRCYYLDLREGDVLLGISFGEEELSLRRLYALGDALLWARPGDVMRIRYRRGDAVYTTAPYTLAREDFSAVE